jgi:hypothetical protein
MATFKLAKKDALSSSRTNIFDLHEKRLEYFESEKLKLGEYTSQLNKLRKEYQKCSIENKYPLSVKIDELEKKLVNIEDDYELNEYLLDFYSIINQEENTYESIINKGQLDTFISSSVNNTRSEVYNEYIKVFNPELKQIELTNIVSKNECQNCKNSSFLFEFRTCTEVCTNCGVSIQNLISEEQHPVYTENIEQVIVFNYKRDNHFQECLNQLQAKENTTIPSCIIKDLVFEFRKYNITNPKLFTPELVKSYLKKLKYNKYYEHIPTIINEICGLPAPKMTPAFEQQLRIMFDEIQVPFEKYRKIICPSRKNFLNYNYTFYKMCQLLNKDEFLNFFPLLKSREKLYEHDQIWKGICTDLRWEYIPSI